MSLFEQADVNLILTNRVDGKLIFECESLGISTRNAIPFLIKLSIIHEWSIESDFARKELLGRF